jgi:Zn-dependent M28 family amino/carboxypeptidase
MSGTVGMQRQQQMLKSHFEKLGGRVTMQPFRGARDPRTRRPVPMANLIVEWQAAARSRILLCAHYDTRPRPDQDPDPVQRERGLFVGANDGASGVALLMELGRCLQGSQRGVDFVFFDGEEYKWDLGPDGYFLGSTHFARNYRAKPPAHRYTAGVLLDMVGDARLSVYQELHSVSWSDTRPIVEQLWATARELGIGEFVPDVGYQVRDDHLPLRQIGRIPVCDLIDFHYPDRTNRYWHTTSDVPANCSAESLGKVGLVVHTWLQRQ